MFFNIRFFLVATSQNVARMKLDQLQKKKRMYQYQSYLNDTMISTCKPASDFLSGFQLV